LLLVFYRLQYSIGSGARRYLSTAAQFMSMLNFMSGSTRFPERAYSYFYSVKLIELDLPEVTWLGEMSVTYYSTLSFRSMAQRISLHFEPSV
jgi:hypothetical protein